MIKTQVEQTLEELNVNVANVKELYTDNVQRIIPKEWYFSIIEKCINLCEITTENINFNKKDRIITIIFKSEGYAEKFEESFHSNVLKAVNNVIQSKNENPKVYNRALILETSQEGISFKISY